MITQGAAATTPTAPLPLGKPVSDTDELSFGDVLSALNPLQYLPVIGTIYRAITGDRPPEGARIGGTLLAGALMGGPIGFAIGVIGVIVQKVTGIDLDSLAKEAVASLGETKVAVADAGTAAQLAAQDMTPPVPDSSQRSAALAAYGQTLFGASHRMGPV